MNKFSNESKKRYEKEKAIVKTIVKRYSNFCMVTNIVVCFLYSWYINFDVNI